MDSLCASKDSRFVREDSEGGSINARFATPALRPKQGTSYADQYRNELQDHGFKFTLNWAF
ncbi:MAG TPA: hypothetical protein VN280_20265 [Variovorax sp.]|nr:hypothetical protein [Variovorax sp.]